MDKLLLLILAIYAHSGTDGDSRSSRETLFSEKLPNMLLNKKEFGIVGGDWNSIISKDDCTRNPEVKISPCFSHFARMLELSDIHNAIHPRHNDFSRYYNNSKHGSGATHIDRIYSYGKIKSIS